MSEIPIIVADGRGGWYAPTATASDAIASGFPMPRDYVPVPLSNDDGAMLCGAIHQPTTYACSLLAHHKQQHKASDGMRILARWSS